MLQGSLDGVAWTHSTSTRRSRRRSAWRSRRAPWSTSDERHHV